MRFQIEKNKWRVRGVLAIASLVLLATAALADDTSITYPAKRTVIGKVMSLSFPLSKGKDGEIVVNEKIYRVTSQTVMVDNNEKRTQMNYFLPGDWVYMVVDLYPNYREALFISPSSDPEKSKAQKPKGNN